MNFRNMTVPASRTRCKSGKSNDQSARMPLVCIKRPALARPSLVIPHNGLVQRQVSRKIYGSICLLEPLGLEGRQAP